MNQNTTITGTGSNTITVPYIWPATCILRTDVFGNDNEIKIKQTSHKFVVTVPREMLGEIFKLRDGFYCKNPVPENYEVGNVYFDPKKDAFVFTYIKDNQFMTKSDREIEEQDIELTKIPREELVARSL